MKNSIFVLFLMVFSSINIFSQSLPNYLTEQEKLQIENYSPAKSSLAGIPTPPKSPVRTMAEWEEIQALTITWTAQFQILREIVRGSKNECEVIIICTDSNSVINYLTSGGVNTTNVSFIQGNPIFNSIWIRDYGQWNVYSNDVDSLLLIDWIYNRTRPRDDIIPGRVADFLNLPIHEMTQAPNDLVHTGGNFMADGMGTGFSSNLILDENDATGNFNITDKDEAKIDSLMFDYMGINRFIKMNTLPYDVIHHIDMHMKLIDEETILVGEYPSGTADGPQIEANIQYIKDNFLSSFGTPYKFIRIPMPPENGNYPDNFGDYRTYTNAVFVNKTVLVPTYEEQYDTTALRIWRETLPGYTIFGINSNAIIPSLGAIHCITKAVGTADPLLIVHQKLQDSNLNPSGYLVSAAIKHKSGIQNARVYYRTDTSMPYQNISMSLSNPADDIWSASIPALQPDDDVHYYIEGFANSGKNQVRPLPAPAGYWKFKILDQVSAVESVIPKTSFEISNVYPNPSKGLTVLPISISQPLYADVFISDLLGRKVQNIFIGELNQNINNLFFSTVKLNSGIYFVQFQSGKEIATQKLIVR